MDARHDAAGYPNYWLRDTRHQYGVRAILAGYPLWEVSQWLRHANQAITADIYLNFGYEIARLIREGTSRSAVKTPVAAKPVPSGVPSLTAIKGQGAA